MAAGELSPGCTKGVAFCGELGLNGSLRHVTGMIALADAAGPLGLVVPLLRRPGGRPGTGAEVRGVFTLSDLVAVLRGQAPWSSSPPPSGTTGRVATPPDLSDVRGHAVGRRALEVAAAGRHHLLMIGPPGSGKTMLAERLVGPLPR